MSGNVSLTSYFEINNQLLTVVLLMLKRSEDFNVK